MTISHNDVVERLLASFAQAKKLDFPYTYWLVEESLPAEGVDAILALPFPAPSLEGISGKRELHNETRIYFDAENQARYPSVTAIARAFQDPRVIAAIQTKFGVPLKGRYLRIEYAQDVDGFWLEPHTDIGVKVFTFLLYLSKDTSHSGLGTDIYDAQKHWVGRTPFVSDSGMIFVPSTITFHGFEPRRIEGVRKSLIINYVTNEWRAREQLAYPEAPIAA